MPGILGYVVIDAYLDELSSALRGPRRITADLLTEARDSLVDAAEVYERQGLDRAAAEQRAVSEFGTVPAIAPEYQAELGISQVRRTALIVFAVLTAQMVTAEYAWRSQAGGWTWEPSAAYGLLARTIDYAGLAVGAVALLVMLGCGRGLRYVERLRPRRWLARATGVAALGVYAFFAVGGMLLTTFSPVGWTFPTTVSGLVATSVGWLASALVPVSAIHCLRAARVNRVTGYYARR
jgi:hypothetical protein